MMNDETTVPEDMETGFQTITVEKHPGKKWADKIFNLIFVIIIALLCYHLGTMHAQDNICSGYQWLDDIKSSDYKVSDRINESQISVTDSYFLVRGDYEWSEYAPTDSMIPTLDEGSSGIYMLVDNVSTLHTGDIISFTTKYQKLRVSHRIIAIGEDDEGWYAVTKGDNVPLRDLGVRRAEDVNSVLVAIIY